MSFHFGLFQFMMPILGWAAGTTLVRYIEDYDHWIAFGLLAYVGGKMIKESFDQDGNLEDGVDPTRKGMLVMLAVATSIDALAVGLSMAMLRS
jgi:putative Mn2+ efflux pump MntP